MSCKFFCCATPRTTEVTEDDASDESPKILNSRSAKLESQDILCRLETAAKDELQLMSRDSATVNVTACMGLSVENDNYFQKRESLISGKNNQSNKISWTDSRKLLEAAIAFEGMRNSSCMSKSSSLVSKEHVWSGTNYMPGTEEERLNKRIERLGLGVVLQRGDGNCQFRSMSWGLYGTPKYHKKVRKAAVAEILTRRMEFEPFLGENFDQYVDSMLKDGVWGDELTLRSLSDHFGVVINVITSDSFGWFQRYIPTSSHIHREIFLAYIAPIHYNAIRRLPKAKNVLVRSFSSLRRKHHDVATAIDQHAAAGIVPPSPGSLLQGI